MEVLLIGKRLWKKVFHPSIEKRSNGKWFETLACKYLKRHKLKILKRNLYFYKKEIDILAWDKRTDSLWVVEVRGAQSVLNRPRYYLSFQKQSNLFFCTHFMGKKVKKVLLLEIIGLVPQNFVKKIWVWVWDRHYYQYEILAIDP